MDAAVNDYVIKPYGRHELRARLEVGRCMVALQTVHAGIVRELQQALDQVRTPRGIVPICARHKWVRDDQG